MYASKSQVAQNDQAALPAGVEQGLGLGVAHVNSVVRTPRVGIGMVLA